MCPKKCTKHDRKHCDHHHSGRRHKRVEAVYVLDPGQLPLVQHPCYPAGLNDSLWKPWACTVSQPWSPYQLPLATPHRKSTRRRSKHLPLATHPDYSYSDDSSSESNLKKGHRDNLAFERVHNNGYKTRKSERHRKFKGHLRLSTSSSSSSSEGSFNGTSVLVNANQENSITAFRNARAKRNLSPMRRNCNVLFKRGKGAGKCNYREFGDLSEEPVREKELEEKEKKPKKTWNIPFKKTVKEPEETYPKTSPKVPVYGTPLEQYPCLEITKEIVNQNKETQKCIKEVCEMILELKNCVCPGDQRRIDLLPPYVMKFMEENATESRPMYNTEEPDIRSTNTMGDRKMFPMNTEEENSELTPSRRSRKKVHDKAAATVAEDESCTCRCQFLKRRKDSYTESSIESETRLSMASDSSLSQPPETEVVECPWRQSCHCCPLPHQQE